jgi:hypothetical protein
MMENLMYENPEIREDSKRDVAFSAAEDMFDATEFDFEFSIAVEMMCSHVDYQTAAETIRKQMEEDREFEKSIRDAIASPFKSGNECERLIKEGNNNAEKEILRSHRMFDNGVPLE